MDPRAGLDRCGKSRPTPGFDPRTVQPVASRYTDYSTRPVGYMNIYFQDIYSEAEGLLAFYFPTIHSISSRPYDRSTASSKASSQSTL